MEDVGRIVSRKHSEDAATILAALPGDRIVQSNALATVTTNCLIVRTPEQRSKTIIPIVGVSGIKTAKTTYPGLLVVSSGCFLISAAAYCSKQEGGAALPAAILGGLFVLAYGVSRRVALLLVTRSDKTATPEGSTREAAELIRAIRSAQRLRAQEDSSQGAS